MLSRVSKFFGLSRQALSPSLSDHDSSPVCEEPLCTAMDDEYCNDDDTHSRSGMCSEPISATDPQILKQVSCESESFSIGIVFDSLENARQACVQFARCPLKQQSTQKLRYVKFSCFRSGSYRKRSSIVPVDEQRQTKSSKCGCPFFVRLRCVQSSDQLHYKVYEISKQHNNDLFSEEELAVLPQNRFIPDNVQGKMLELNQHGILSCSQIMTLIEKQHFPDIKVTWTLRDVQNLFQKFCNRKQETTNFVKLLEKKAIDGWERSMELNEESLRLERIFWISGTGKQKYLLFNDVIEIDATYKTNR